MSSTAVDVGPATGSTSSRPRPWRPRHVGRWVALGLVLVFVVGMWIRHRVDQDHLRRPLEVVQRASERAHKPIAVLAPSTARRWTDDNGGPPEVRVRALARPGNGYLEPLYYYYSGLHGGPGAGAVPPQGRCYYFAAQHGDAFDADRVSALVQLCYVDSAQAAYAAGWVAVQ